MKNKINKVVSKIVISQNKNKKIVTIIYKSYYKTILNILWNEGFIRGFSCLKKNKENYFKIYLKYSEKKNHSFKKLFFFNCLLNKKKLKKVTKIEKNYSYFLINSSGFFLHKSCIKLGVGGFIFIRI